MSITYCCYGAYADIGHSDDCPEAAKRRVEASGSPELRDLRATFGNWPVPELSGLVKRKPALDGWQSMEAAPRDGSEILLLVPHRLRAGRRLRLTGRWFDRYWITFNADEAIQRVEPTAWQPLPPLPDSNG